MLSLRLRTHGAALLTALVATCVLAAPAGAANKPYSVVITPGTAVAGATVAFQATITNGTTSQTLGSANLTAPAGFTVLGASVRGQTQAFSASVAQLRNLGIAPGASVVAIVNARVALRNPCAPDTFTWSVAAKQANDFNGPPGNEFGPLVDSSLTTSTTCGGTATQCTLASCVGTLNGADASIRVDVANSAGLLTISRGAGIDCAGYDEILAQDFTVDFQPNLGTIGGTKIVTINITKAAMQASANNGLAQVNMCFEAPFTFPVKPGTPALQQPTPGVYRGLLPDCGAPPCVADRQSVGGGARIMVRAPGGNEDPRYGP